MKRTLPYIIFYCLTGLTATSGLPVMASGCSSHTNKKVEIKCATDDAECQTQKAEKFELNNKVRS